MFYIACTSQHSNPQSPDSLHHNTDDLPLRHCSGKLEQNNSFIRTQILTIKYCRFFLYSCLNAIWHAINKCLLHLLNFRMRFHMQMLISISIIWVVIKSSATSLITRLDTFCVGLRNLDQYLNLKFGYYSFKCIVCFTCSS